MKRFMVSAIAASLAVVMISSPASAQNRGTNKSYDRTKTIERGSNKQNQEGNRQPQNGGPQAGPQNGKPQGLGNKPGRPSQPGHPQVGGPQNGRPPQPGGPLGPGYNPGGPGHPGDHHHPGGGPRPAAAPHGGYHAPIPGYHPSYGHNHPSRFGPLDLTMHILRCYEYGSHYYGYRLAHLSWPYSSIRVKGVTYYIKDGVYYRRNAGYYYVCRPPHGQDFYRNQFSPFALRQVDITYYDRYGYQADPLEHELLSLSRAMGLDRQYAVEGSRYYYYDGVFYLERSYGSVMRAVIPPFGAIVEYLPDDAYALDQYIYRCDDTIYALVFMGGRSYYQVIGQDYYSRW